MPPPYKRDLAFDKFLVMSDDILNKSSVLRTSIYATVWTHLPLPPFEFKNFPSDVTLSVGNTYRDPDARNCRCVNCIRLYGFFFFYLEMQSTHTFPWRLVSF